MTPRPSQTFQAEAEVASSRPAAFTAERSDITANQTPSPTFPDQADNFVERLRTLVQFDPRMQLMRNDVHEDLLLVPDSIVTWPEKNVADYYHQVQSRFDDYIRIFEAHFAELGHDTPQSYTSALENVIENLQKLRDRTPHQVPVEIDEKYTLRGADRQLSLLVLTGTANLISAMEGDRDFTDQGISDRITRLGDPGSWIDTSHPNLKFGDIGQFNDEGSRQDALERLEASYTDTLNLISRVHGTFGQLVIDTLQDKTIIITSGAQIANPHALASNGNIRDNAHLIDFNSLGELDDTTLRYAMANELFDIVGREHYGFLARTTEYQLLGFVFHEAVAQERALSREEILTAFATPMNLYLLEKGWTNLSPEHVQQLDELTNTITGGQFNSFAELRDEARQFEHMSMGY